MSLLTHSLRIKRLDLNKAVPAASADADFSRLAYYKAEEKRIVNGSNPYLSSTVCAQPFEQALMLRPGVHLHFILPQAITHFYEDASRLLPAPNRWLIKKLEGTTVRNAWVLESDYLSTAPSINGQVSTLLPIDIDTPGYEVFKGQTQPYRFMGRVLKAEDYFSRSESVEGDYWGSFMSEQKAERPFTAFAYGNLNFASFYSNCHSVFGFHDMEGTAEHSYEVYGWYATSEAGTEQLAYLEALHKFATTEPNPTERDWQDEFGLEGKGQLDGSEKQLLFYGKAEKTDQDKPIGEVKLAMGNDVEEALSTFVANEMHGKGTAAKELENQLEALQFGLLGVQDLDLKPNFEARRHARTFKAHQGNTFLGLELYSYKKAEDKDQRQKQLWQLEEEVLTVSSATLTRLRDAVADLNKMLLEYEQKLNEIKSRQLLLHAHWQKYLEAAHPPIGMAHLLPNPDDMLVFIRDKAIADLRQLMEATGALTLKPIGTAANTSGEDTVTLEIAEDDQWEQAKEVISRTWQLTGAAFKPATQYANSLADQILKQAHLLNPLLAELNEFKVLTDHGSKYCFKFELGQRFFEPSMPTLLLASPSFKELNLASGQDRHIGKQPWLLKLGTEPEPINSFKEYLRSLINTTPGFMSDLEVTGEVRQPAYMDWELYFYPVDNVNAEKRKYTEHFIDDSFNLRQNSPEFTLKADEVAYTSAVSRYTGRSSLMATDGSILTDKLEALPKGSKELEGVEDIVKNNGYLVQVLTGFNQAFAQQRDSMQLPVGDPIAFEDYKTIYRNMGIADFIGGQRQNTPVADFDFNPVRAGGSKITRVHLIDSFGRHFPIEGDEVKVSVPETMEPPGVLKAALANVPEVQAFFPPRFMQAVALRAHWLVASQATDINSEDKSLLHVNTNESPVAGWVVYNSFYKWLLIFNTAGEHVYSLVKDSEQVKKLNAPEEPAGSIDPYLERFVNYLVERAGSDQFNGILETIKDALYQIDPEGDSENDQLNLLFGRPLALLRMFVSFELKGDYLRRMDHAAFRKMLSEGRHEPTTAGYEKVEIPLRIGDYRKLNDGVVLCWQDPDRMESALEGEADWQFTHSSVALSEKKSHKVIHSHLSTQSLVDKPQRFGMLMDPRAEVHLCAGVVPMAIMRIPERYWKRTLQQLRYNLRLGPLMFPQDQIMLDLPASEGRSWAWLQRDATGKLSKTPEQLAIRQARYEEALEILKDEGLQSWKQLVDDGILVGEVFGKAGYAFVNLKLLQDGPKYKPMMAEYLSLFEKYGTRIDPLSRNPIWRQNELHDGWAQLYPDPELNKTE